MQLAVGAPLVGAVLAGVQYFDTHLWQAVVLSYIGAPLVGAYIIVMAPLLLQLLPRAGGLGERLGVLLAPFNLCSVVLAYVAAGGDRRHRQLPADLAVPGRHRPGPGRRQLLAQVPATDEPRAPTWSSACGSGASSRPSPWPRPGIVAGLLAAPLLGVVTEEDADSAVVIDMARNILGNPYEEIATGGPLTVPSLDAEAGGPPDDQSRSGDGGRDGVTGVRQVGGGPVDGLDSGDRKSGRGEPWSPGSPGAGDLTTGVPDAGVAPDDSAGPSGGGTLGAPTGSSGDDRATETRVRRPTRRLRHDGRITRRRGRPVVQLGSGP